MTVINNNIIGSFKPKLTGLLHACRIRFVTPRQCRPHLDLFAWWQKLELRNL